MTKEEKEYAVKSQNQALYAKEVLLMCNVNKAKNIRSQIHTGQTIEFLRKGEGKTIGSIDLTNL